MSKPKQFDDSQALNEWVIAHPGTGEIIKCESFDEAMRDWFEGFNMPIRVEDGAPEVHQAYIDQYKGAIRVIRNMKEALEDYARVTRWLRLGGADRCVFTGEGHGFELAQEALAELKETNDEWACTL